ncbi:hypothetical protein CspeluHIS016_0101580 [Cutaneotrichosporon spelunceum]|uniref:F-box domain-containing protein n=1 Tax=Cutaneotrichosporon spelunceum TaxID=1672016 RepID=A0AAD3Y994_9TREE|nr:hypothetical protein CspeluHIS016_0101580 [Cutaneotrichosporon spelunceum]
MPDAPTSAHILDASAYPHILETILAHADYAALLALRTVSHALRDAVDARLATHVRLHIPCGVHVHSPGPLMDVKLDVRLLRERMRRLEVSSLISPGGKLPVFMHWAGSVAPVRHRSTYHPPCDPDSDATIASTPAEEDAHEVAARRAARRAVRVRCAAALSTARVVDVTSFPAAWVRDGAADLLKALGADVYRFHGPWCAWSRPMDAATGVVFTPLLLGRGEWVIPCPYTTFRGPRLTINLTGFRVLDPADAVFPPTADAVNVVSAAAEVVINFAALASRQDTSPGHLGLVFPTARVVFRNPTARFMLVSAEAVDPVVFGHVCADGQDPDELRGVIVTVVNRLRSWYPNYWNAEAIETLPERIAMRTLEEYRAEIGDEQYALEAMA